MNLKLQTNENLSVISTNGLADIFINGTSFSSHLSSKLNESAAFVEWENNETYDLNEIVSHNGRLWKATAPDPIGEPGSGIDWQSTNIRNILNSYAKSSDIKNATVTVKQGNVTKGSFTLNQAANYTLSLDAGGGVSGSTVEISADYQSGTKIATISVDNIPTSIYVPNSATGSLRYALATAELQTAGNSLSCAVDDQTITTIEVSSSSTPIIVQLPEAPQDGARDFILRIEISSSAAPTFTFNGVSETIDFDSEDDDWAVLEPGLNLISFTETKRGSESSSSGGNNGESTTKTVTFNITDGAMASLAQLSFTNQSDATRQVTAGQPVGSLPTVNVGNDGFDFSMWGTTTSRSTAELVTSATVITDDVTFYAICTMVDQTG